MGAGNMTMTRPGWHAEALSDQYELTSRERGALAAENGPAAAQAITWRAEQAEWARELAAPALCRACTLDDWDGTGALPFNPDAGPCANCGGKHAELFSGCCAACYRAGYREACSRVHS